MEKILGQNPKRSQIETRSGKYSFPLQCKNSTRGLQKVSQNEQVYYEKTMNGFQFFGHQNKLML